MTKEAYFDMCEQLGSDPIEEEIPIDMEDFPELVQTCFLIYSKLSDIWDYFNGVYTGKDFNILFSLFNLYGVTTECEQVLCIEFLQTMDKVRVEEIAEKARSKKPAK